MEKPPNIKPDVQSIIHLIAQHGNNLIGLELGVAYGNSFCYILQQCPNVSILYGVDSWKPYKDYIKSTYDGASDFYRSQKDLEVWKFFTYHNIKHSGFSHKAKILEKDSNSALNDIPDNYLDFIFLDAYLTYEQVVNDLRVWYPKVKKGGLFSGHDFNSDAVRKAVYNFRKEFNITSLMSIHDDTFVWKK